VTVLRRLLAGLGGLLALAAQAQQWPTDERLRALLQERIDANLGVGIVVGLVDGKGKVVEASIAFGREDGKVTHLLLHQNGRVQRAQRLAP
jgi:hypothetical protein